MKKKTLGRVLIVIIAIVAAWLRFSRRMNNINQRESERKKLVEQAETVKKFQNTLNNQDTKTSNFLKSIADKKKNESNTESNNEYDEYTPIEVNLGIGKKDNKYYIVDGKANTSVEIKDVKNVYVLYINDIDYKEEYNGIFIQDNQGWKLIDSNQEVLVDLGEIEIHSKSQIEIKENKISIK